MLSPLTWTGSTPPLSLYPIIHLHSSYQKSYSIQLNSSIASHLFLWLWNNIPMNSNLTLTKEDIIYLSLIKKYHTFTTPQVFKHLSPKTLPLLISQWVLLLVTYNGALCYVSSVNHKHLTFWLHLPVALMFWMLRPLLPSNRVTTVVIYQLVLNFINQLPLLTNLALFPLWQWLLILAVT